MALFITSLNSGSNGNCFYISNDKEAILVDAGISCREIEIRMKRLELSMKKVRAVFISHEHGDHTRGISVLSKKYQIPVYITQTTQRFGGIKLATQLSQSFQSLVPVPIGDLTIIPFPKFHDAADPYSFIIACKDIKVGIFTDIGKPCHHVKHHFAQCHAAFLESNYDEDLLENGPYPYHLKNRIRGGNGHLSNSQALQLFKEYKPAFMTHLFLSHLSKNNNCPDLVSGLFNRHAGNTKIVIASRYEETPVYYIQHPEAIELTSKGVNASQLQFMFELAAE